MSDLFNQLTGYSNVELRKQRVIAKDAALLVAREEARQAKASFEENILERRKVQKELNSLLQRKDSWLHTDIDRFTELYRQDLALEQVEQQAQNTFRSATEHCEALQSEYLSEIREQYFEEQLYSDKIRRASTWWTWALISSHFVLFIVVQLFVEPQKKDMLKAEVRAIILETSDRDRELIAKQLEKISMGYKQEHKDQEQQEQQEQHSDGSIRPEAQTEIGPNKIDYLANLSPFWKGAFAGAAISLLGSILLFGRAL
eukprot:jgi/Hompol1/4159/HPOL_003504-RA